MKLKIEKRKYGNRTAYIAVVSDKPKKLLIRRIFTYRAAAETYLKVIKHKLEVQNDSNTHSDAMFGAYLHLLRAKLAEA